MAVPKEWIEQVRDYENSGLLQVAWCRARGIPIGTFQYRLQRVRTTQVTEKFLELKPKTTGIRLKWGKVVLELEPHFDPVTLRGLFQALSSCS
ncbi:MAG: hypothetical protein FJZ58_00910 [Chlamydiae bacterium]|jgi:hypothetical protein|nr:hypothetical protein [Chlamydiota bacterium]MBM3197801.1 hypothetical protein [Chlamydiota bacterium]